MTTSSLSTNIMLSLAGHTLSCGGCLPDVESQTLADVQAEQLQQNSRMLASKLREADDRTKAAESLLESHRLEAQGLQERLALAERASAEASRTQTGIVKGLQAKLEALSTASADVARPSVSPEGKLCRFQDHIGQCGNLGTVSILK